MVGPDGNDQASGADELYCDKLGRVRIRFHWQDNADATCWVRVAQRSAGGWISATGVVDSVVVRRGRDPQRISQKPNAPASARTRMDRHVSRTNARSRDSLTRRLEAAPRRGTLRR